MLWIYLGHRAVVTLADGETTFRGTIAWSWASGFLRLRHAQILDDQGEPAEAEIVGSTFIPRSNLALVQVI